MAASGAGFALNAMAGQPAAGPASGANAELVAGFWSVSPAAPGAKVYLPLILR